MAAPDLDTDRLTSATPLRDVRLDHVAVAVDDVRAGAGWWREEGAVPVIGMEGETFSTEQVRLGNGGKVELLGPGRQPSFIGAYLRRHGPGRVHHITLKVPAPLQAAVQRVQAAGLDVVDVDTSGAHWHEAFLRPSQVGGVIVQLAWADLDDSAFAVSQGQPIPPTPDPAAPALLQVVLGHDDLPLAAALWRLLGAAVDAGPDRVTSTFGDSPVAVAIEPAEQPGPLGLRIDRPARGSGPMSPAWLPA